MTKIAVWFIKRLEKFTLNLAIILLIILIIITCVRIIVLELQVSNLQEEVSYYVAKNKKSKTKDQNL
jgi:cell division protein FtsB